MDKKIYITAITEEEGARFGYGDHELGEFEKPADLQEICRCLRLAGYSPHLIGFGADFARRLAEVTPCLVWNLNMGIKGLAREAHASAMIEHLGAHLIGPGPWSGVMTQDKSAAALLVSTFATGICVAPSISVDTLDELDVLTHSPFPGPWFVKPRFEGSSRGIDAASCQHTFSGARQKMAEVLERWGPVRCEQWTPGIDVSVNLCVDERGTLMPIPPVVIDTRDGFDHILMKADYTLCVRRQMPLKSLYPEHVAPVEAAARQLGKVFRARHYLRTDCRLNVETDQITFLEANTTPSFSYDDEFVYGLAAAGICFEEMVRNIADSAWRELGT